MSRGDPDLQQLEAELNSFSLNERREALAALCQEVRCGRIALPEPGGEVNLHAHTFFSYNAYGYSPTGIAWLARKRGWAVAGIVDFDVLDGLDEFLEAARLLQLKACGGMETRVFVPEFADLVINSPGEPGISYHVGAGFPESRFEGSLRQFARELHRGAEERNRALVIRVNGYLSPVVVDYDAEVLPLTPSGNPSERHICLAYARKAHTVFQDGGRLARYWAGKLGIAERDLPQGADLQALIRAKTMKQGGVGYVCPDAGSFPRLADTNRFILAAGGIPTLTWLDGTSDGEARIEELLTVMRQTGVAAINIIPDRNYRPGMKDRKLANLYHVVALAEELGLPVVVGTEMNSPGQRLVDDFGTRELSPLTPVFLKGAHIVYAHSLLQRASGKGYTSDWARISFPSVAARNEFFHHVGRRLYPSQEDMLAGLPEDVTPEAILGRIDP